MNNRGLPTVNIRRRKPDRLWKSFLLPQGNYFGRYIAGNVDSAATGRIAKSRQR